MKAVCNSTFFEVVCGKNKSNKGTLSNLANEFNCMSKQFKLNNHEKYYPTFYSYCCGFFC